MNHDEEHISQRGEECLGAERDLANKLIQDCVEFTHSIPVYTSQVRINKDGV